MKQRKKGMQEQPAATRKVGANELSDDLLKKASGGAHTRRHNGCYNIYDDNGNYVGSTYKKGNLALLEQGMKSAGLDLDHLSDSNACDYILGGGVNGEWGKNHGY